MDLIESSAETDLVIMLCDMRNVLRHISREFLNATFRNVLCSRWETHCSLTSLVAFAALASGRLRLAVRRKLEDAGYRRRWRRSHAHCRCWRRGHAPPVRKPNPNLNQRHPLALFCLKLDNSCCYARCSCGNNCNVVVKLVQEYHCFLYILLPFCRNS